MTETMYKIQTLEKLIDSGMDDGLIDKTLSKLIQYKTDKMERELQELKDSMKRFESGYNMDSETFYKKFGEGGLGDEMDFFKMACSLRYVQADYGAAEMPDEKTTLQQQIDAIGGQIDQVVYELYGLTGGDQPYCDNAVTSTMTIRAGWGMTRET